MAEVNAVELKKYDDLTTQTEETTSDKEKVSAETKNAEESIYTSAKSTVSIPTDSIYDKKAASLSKTYNPMAEVAAGSEMGDTVLLSSGKEDAAIENRVKQVISAVMDSDYSGIKENDPYASKKMFMAKTMQGAVTYGVDRKKLEELTVQYAKDMKNAKTIEEKRQAGIKYKRATRMKINEKLIEERLKTARDNGTLTPEEYEVALKDFEKFESRIISIRLGLAESKEEEELAFENDANDQEDVAKSLARITNEYMPKDITEETAKKYLDILEKYPQRHMNHVAEILASGNYSGKFIDKITNLYKDAIKRATEYTKQFIQEFWESEKGKAIKAYTKHRMEEVQEAKEKRDERREETEIAKEKATEATTLYEKAIELAKTLIKKAIDIALKFGYKYLGFKELHKVVKQESPRQANELIYAMDAKKKAYWAEYDANVEKRHAEFLEGLANKNLEFARARAGAAMMVAQNFFC